MGIENTKDPFETMRNALERGTDHPEEQYVSPEGTKEEIEQKIKEQRLHRASNTNDAEALKEIDARIEELETELEKLSA